MERNKKHENEAFAKANSSTYSSESVSLSVSFLTQEKAKKLKGSMKAEESLFSFTEDVLMIPYH